jgi:hypothetical protein
MHGAIGFAQNSTTISAGSITVDDNGGDDTISKSFIAVSPESGLTDTLQTITGRKYPGQLIILTNGTVGSTITLQHNNGLNVGDMVCPDSADYDLVYPNSVILIDDPLFNVQTWRVIGTAPAAASGITESSTPVIWTGIHSFNGTGTSINSATISLGDSNTDNLFITAKIASTLIPDADDTYSLGAPGEEWRNLYIDGTANLDIVAAGAITTNTLVTTSTTILGNSSTDGIQLVGNIDTDVIIDGGKRVRSYDSQEIGIQVTNDSITTGTEGTLQIPWLGSSSATKAAADTDFGNATACIAINEIAGTPALLARKSDGSWWGVNLTSFFP